MLTSPAITLAVGASPPVIILIRLGDVRDQIPQGRGKLGGYGSGEYLARELMVSDTGSAPAIHHLIVVAKMLETELFV